MPARFRQTHDDATGTLTFEWRDAMGEIDRTKAGFDLAWPSISGAHPIRSVDLAWPDMQGDAGHDPGVRKVALDKGLPTFHTRVESWECDFNGHWNTRFYARAFQSAAAVCASMNGDQGGARDAVLIRHCRFHNEMASGDAVEIRSSNVIDLTGVACIAHHMFSHGNVVATALDVVGRHNRRLPDLARSDAAQALPRGLTDPSTQPWSVDPAKDFPVELGPVRDLEPDGEVRFDGFVSRLSIATQHHAAGLGLSHAYTKQTGIARMLVEMRFSRLGRCAPGECLAAASRLVSAQGKAFSAAHMLYTHSGQSVAMFDLYTLCVDLTTRRAIPVPDFLKALAN